MTIRVKSGDIGAGVWLPVIGSGEFRVKSGAIGGGSWIYPAAVKAKVGSAWVNSGYVGYPAVPATIAVNTWSYSAVSIKWTAGAGGAPATSFEILQRKYPNAGDTVKTDTASPSTTFAVTEDTKYQYFVRAKSAAGLYSAYTPALEVGIGHPKQDTYGYVARTRAWTSPTVSGSHNKDDDFVVVVPSTVKLSGMHWRNMRTPQSSVVTPYGSRTVNWVIAGADFGPIDNDVGTVLSGDNTDWAFTNQGNGTNWGVVPRGSGWSTTGNATYQLALDSLWMAGTETYQSYEIISTIAEKPNYYW